MALGARPEQIRSHFFSIALRLLAGGMILGVIGAWLTGHAIQAVLFHVPGFDVATLALAAGILGVVSLVASLLPCHRAARVSPMEALADR
jgi:ABC-type antimicrobial peptide transport system permease subunit